jgi:hypothetical protein
MFAISSAVFAFEEIAEPGIDFDSLSVRLSREVFEKVKVLKSFGDSLRETFALPIELALSAFDENDNGVNVRSFALVYKLTDALDVCSY